MDKVRIGIVGLGNMGSAHAANIQAGKIRQLELTAVSDMDTARFARVPGVKGFAQVDDMMSSGLIDAILIATPHYDHTSLGIKALKAGLHVMVEKPISVHRADAERLIAAYSNKKQVFAAMFNQRTDLYYRKIRQLIQSGELGELRRVNWIITNWFRTEAYYGSGGWRATWAGEGGGVLLNQCPHNLDLFQWMFGMPQRVRGFCQFGRFHQIEVEDDVTAVLLYDSGLSATFVTSTGEAPGCNRLEITGEQGRVTVTDNTKIHFQRNRQPMSKFCMEAEAAFAMPENWHIDIPVEATGGQHVEILQNFANAITKGEKLLSPAEEGIRSVELANAVLLSTWQDKTIELPMSSADYERILVEKGEKSTFQKTKVVAKATADDFAKSFR